MNILELPFNAHVGLERCDDGQDGLLRLPADNRYTNHLGTVHASALFSLAEASSGELLIAKLGDSASSIGAMVRRTETKFKKPATGEIRSMGGINESDWSAAMDQLAGKGRALITIKIKIVDANDQIVSQSAFDWFLAKQDA